MPAEPVRLLGGDGSRGDEGLVNVARRVAAVPAAGVDAAESQIMGVQGYGAQRARGSAVQHAVDVERDLVIPRVYDADYVMPPAVCDCFR